MDTLSVELSNSAFFIFELIKKKNVPARSKFFFWWAYFFLEETRKREVNKVIPQMQKCMHVYQYTLNVRN